MADWRPNAISVRRRIITYRNTQKRSVIDLKITIRDALLILKAVIRITLITTLSNILLLIKSDKDNNLDFKAYI